MIAVFYSSNILDISITLSEYLPSMWPRLKRVCVLIVPQTYYGRALLSHGRKLYQEVDGSV